MNLTIILFGDNGYNTLGALRSLRMHNIDVFLLLVSRKRINYVLTSKFIQKYRVVKNEQEGINFLLNNFSEEKTVILPTSDRSVSLLDKNYNKLQCHYIFPNVGRQDCLNEWMDKEKMITYAFQAGLNVPFTFRYKRGNLISENVIYPCFVKPTDSVSGSKKDIKKCNNNLELEQILNDTKPLQEYLIQQYIDKEFDLLLIGTRLMSNDKIIIPAVFVKERWYGMGDDGSMGKLTTDVEQYISLKEVVSFVQSTNYYGPFSVEFGVVNNKAYFYEINFRNDGTSHYFAGLNVNVPLIWILDAYGFDYSPHTDFKKEDYYFIDEFGDYLNIVTNHLSIRQWYKDFKRASVYKYYNKDDIKPFFFSMPYMVLLSLYKVLKHLIRKWKG